MALQIIRNNIINVSADAIVNTANPEVAVGRGVDYEIYKAAGFDELLEARKAIGPMMPGQAAYTPAFGLDAKYIIHTVGPAWRGGAFGERETVAACYRNSLFLANALGCESVAFPLIATGTYGFPKDEALRIAINEISKFLLENEMEVMLVVYDKESFRVSGKLFSEIREFIGDSEATYDASPHQSNRRSRILFSGAPFQSRRAEKRAEREEAARITEPDLLEDLCDYEASPMFGEEAYPDAAGSMPMEPLGDATGAFPCEPIEAPVLKSYAPSFPSVGQSLDERLIHLDKTFQEYLFMLIDRKGLTDPEVYKKANIDRKHFSKIRSNVDYMPSKRTALALALALELNVDETKDLLARAGLALSPSIISDRIIEYCIETENYDIYDINCILFEYDQPLLGA